jgi:hypothetical protein
MCSLTKTCTIFRKKNCAIVAVCYTQADEAKMRCCCEFLCFNLSVINRSAIRSDMTLSVHHYYLTTSDYLVFPASVFKN